ncbi:MAG: DMT family transporter [Arenicellales bacterium]|nr:DMT family transporter [Arenicellales bacterium]
MTVNVFAMVLFAAVLHAVWNALVKVDGDRLAIMAVMMVSQAVISVCVLPFVTFPSVDAWPYILASVALHNGYYLFLIMSYRYGDLSHVYPLARGSAPLMVAAISVAFVGEVLSRQSVLSVALITVGVMSLALTRGASGFREPKAVLFALGTGLFIAGYTVVDGVGARLAGSAHGYTFWLFALDGLPLVALTIFVRKRAVLYQPRQFWVNGVLAGLASLVAYWIVIWAMTLAPFALVSALRETSVIFAVLFGIVFLKERLDLVRLLAIGTTLVGTVMLRVSK